MAKSNDITSIHAFDMTPLVAHLKAEYQYWKADGFFGADPGIVPALEILNSFESVATQWSCEGHLASESIIGNGFEITCAVTPPGFSVLLEVFHALTVSVGKTDLRTEDSHRLFDLKMNEHTVYMHARRCMVSYYAFTLASNRPVTEKVKEELLTYLLAVLKEVQQRYVDMKAKRIEALYSFLPKK
jgi:hypothetical protein